MGSERRRAERDAVGSEKGRSGHRFSSDCRSCCYVFNLSHASRRPKLAECLEKGKNWRGHFDKKSQGSDRKHEHEVADRPVVRMRDVDARTAQRNNLPPPKLLARSVLGFDHMPNPQALSNRGVSTRIPGLSYCFCCGNLPMPSLKLPRLHTYRDRGLDRARPVLSAKGEQY